MFVVEARAIHGNAYEYPNEYQGTDIKLLIWCRKHELSFEQRPHLHLSGSRCPRCAREASYMTQDEFDRKSKEAHNGKVTALEPYVAAKTKLLVECSTCHHRWKQLAQDHILGFGCARCANNTKSSTEEFVRKATAQKGVDRYDYSLVTYVGARQHVTIMCLKCDLVFCQTPNAHLTGRGCPRCAQEPRYVSNAETAWLDKLNIDPSDRQQRPPEFKTITVDALVDRTIYEFYGTYYHGDPRVYDPSVRNERCQMTMGELYDRTLRREQALHAAGYEVKFVWELDFDAGLTFSHVHPERRTYATERLA